MAAWIALEDIDRRSGPLLYVPGSHRLPYFQFAPGEHRFDQSRHGEEETRAMEEYDRAQCAARGLSTTVADARFAKPLDEELVRRLALEHEVLLTVEDGSIGGFSSQVLHCLAHAAILETGVKVRPLLLPDRFIDHDKPERMYELAGLDARAIADCAIKALGRAQLPDAGELA